MSKRRRIQSVLEFSSGLLAIILANISTYIFFDLFVNKIIDYSIHAWEYYFLIVVLTFIVVFAGFSSPLNMMKRSKSMEFLSTLRNCSVTYAIMAVFLLLSKNEILDSRYMFIGSFFAYLWFSLAFRFAIKIMLLKKISESTYASQTGIITTYDRAEPFIEKLKLDWSKNIKAVALLDANLSAEDYYTVKKTKSGRGKRIESICDVPVVANSDNVISWIRTASLDEVFINLNDTGNDVIDAVVEELEDMGITVYVNISSLEKFVDNSKFDNLNCVVKTGYPMAVLSPAVQNNKLMFIKRCMDIVLGLIGCILSLPIIAITAIPLLIESPGPLIFKQQRVGKNGRLFNIYKLRSMYVDAEERRKALMEQNQMDGHMFKMDNDPRITKVGKVIRKLSIDELPQFFNVLKGDMSLIGTRPPTVDEFEKYESHHKRRLSMKPGITGLWQVSGRSEITDFEEVVKLDCEYIDNWSGWLDTKIFFKTIGVVLTHKGAE